MLSVHTNKTAMLALQNLNATNDQLSSTQDKVSTGLKINNAKDNAAVWSIAQAQRGDVSALSAVTASLNRATSITDVAMTRFGLTYGPQVRPRWWLFESFGGWWRRKWGRKA